MDSESGIDIGDKQAIIDNLLEGIIKDPTAKIKFVSEPHYDIPASYDLSQFSTDERKKKAVANFIKSAEAYLQLPTFTDSFGSDHRSRKLWRDDIHRHTLQEYGPKIAEELNRELHNNKLAMQPMDKVFSRVDMMVIYDIDTDVPEELIDPILEIRSEMAKGSNRSTKIVEETSSNYDKMSDEDKIEVTQRLSQKVVNLLQHFSA